MIDLEIVAPGVWDDAAVEDVNLAKPPAIKSGFFEGVVEQVGFADLQISISRSQSAYSECRRNASHIFMVSNPGDRSSPTVHVGKFKKLGVLDAQPVRAGREDKVVPIRTMDGLPGDCQVDWHSVGVRGKALVDFRCERKRGRKRNGANLRKVVGDQPLIKQE